MVLPLLAAALIVDQDFPPLIQPAIKRWFVFLNTGPNKTPLTKEQSEAGMKGHLGNFGEQYKLGALDLAGPLGGGTTTRGIVAVRAKDVRGVEALFKSDPFIQSKHLALEVYQMDGPFERILHPDGDPAMVTLSIVIFKKGPNWSKSKPCLPAKLAAWDKDGKLAYWCKFVGSKTDKVGMAYFWSNDAKVVEPLVKADARVASGELSYQLLPQYIGDMFVKP